MSTTATVRKPAALRRHRTIERPRLFKLLDSSNARVRTLVAPAGYGKSTLAEQWASRNGRLSSWFTARPWSTDVAALALGLAEAAKSIVPDCDARLREHLRALPAPAENVETLAEVLGEDLAGWPARAWLILDDYQEVSNSPEAERFIAALISISPIQLLVASRTRPSWVTERALIYGELQEVTRDALAMDEREAGEVLSGRSAESASGLTALANGWPAVIGLASVSTAEVNREAAQVPELLYRFFAQEVFSGLGTGVQAGLTTLAIAPILDRELATRVLGRQDAEEICEAALGVGVLVERDGRLQLHPLARSFLEERAGEDDRRPAEQTIGTCLDYYWQRHEWDAAFELISRRGPRSRLESLFCAAVDELLETARLSTLAMWCELAAKEGVDAPIVSIASAEVALRHGRYAEAQAHADKASSSESGFIFRALATAGRAAHLGCREEEGLAFYQRAELAASEDAERRDAQWGQFMCCVELEDPGVDAMLARLSADVRGSDAREIVRAAACRLSYQVKFGPLDLTDADQAFELLDTVQDPLTVSAFQNTYAAVLALASRYEEALVVARDLFDTARRYRLDFVIPHAHCCLALASAGLRDWKQAEANSTEAMNIASATRDWHLFQLSYALHVRILAQQGRHAAALALELPDLRSALLAARAEVMLARALVLASTGRTTEALELCSDVRGISRAVEPTVLVAAVDAMVALRTRDQDLDSRVRELEATAFETGAVDLLITAYRSTPELLGLLLRLSPNADRLAALVRRVGDSDLARVAGQTVDITGDPKERLTPREVEVYDLLCQGLSNAQIAKLLFISESTAKRHTLHIFEKLKVRSRTALAVYAALHRTSPHATSAIESAESSDDR